MSITELNTTQLTMAIIDEICHNNIDSVLKMLQDGYPVDFQEPNIEKSPLGFACFIQNVNIVQILLDKNANINYQALDGTTPLMKCRNIDCANKILDAGAIVTLIDDHGNSALHYASWYTHGPQIILAICSKYPMRDFINQINNDNKTPLKFALQRGIRHSVKNLLTAGADPDISGLNIAEQAYLNRIIEEMGGEAGIQQAHATWIANLPGRNVKAVAIKDRSEF